jgi:flagellar hook-associated protein 2
MTLNELKEAINAASGDTGVSAAIVGTSSSYKLRLTSPKDGIAYSFNDDAGQALATNPMDFSSTAVHSSADATLQVNGTTITRTNNTITDIIPGVTLSLKKQDPATTVTVDVEKDAQSISSKVTKFVNAYNDVLSTIQKQSTYNAEAKSTGGVLFGDPTMKAIKNKIQNVVLNARSSSGDALSNLGLEFNSSGKLTFDSTEFETALETNASETVSFFNTFAASLSTALDTYTDSIDGAVTTRKKGIQSSIDLLTKKINTTQDRIDRQMALLTDQFIKMDSAVGDMQTQASYVAAQLGT